MGHIEQDAQTQLLTALTERALRKMLNMQELDSNSVPAEFEALIWEMSYEFGIYRPQRRSKDLCELLTQ